MNIQRKDLKKYKLYMMYKGDYSWPYGDCRETVLDAVFLVKDREERDNLLYYQVICHEISGLFACLL